jgi:hypothetical protein
VAPRRCQKPVIERHVSVLIATSREQETSVFHHAKELQFNARVSQPDPRFAALLLEQFGGGNGELSVLCGRPLGFKSFGETSDGWSTAFMCPAC